MGESLEGWLTVAEAAALAGVSAAAIRKRIRAGRLAARRVGPNCIW
jgi:excisionase family DNA binding protein